MKTRKLVLDTCAWIWLATGHPRITSEVFALLEKADWFLSAISIWELAMLVKKGRLEINSSSINHWLDEALIVPNLTLANLLPEIAIKSCNLSDYPYSDPADNIIIATALHYKASLVTGDKRMIEYGKKGHLNVIGI